MNKRDILLIILLLISITFMLVKKDNKYLVNNDYIASYVNGTLTSSIPEKGTVAFEKADCNDSINVEWNNDTWSLFVSNLSSKLKCNLYFKTGENAVNKITTLASNDSTNFASDDPDGNIRYIGKNPNNYVYFNCSDYSNQTSDTCEKWRIIGVFNNITKEDGTSENLIKLVREDAIGSYSWDSSSSDVLEGKGRHYWYSSMLMKLLNPGYDFFEANNSLYYNSTVGKCYYGLNLINVDCSFTTNGLKNKNTKDMIENVYWLLGQASTYQTTKEIYDFERNYSVDIKTWLGRVALIYASDYLYATSGSKTTGRSTCISTVNEQLINLSDCADNNYLNTNENKWVMTPNLKWENNVLTIASGVIGTNNAYDLRYHVNPSLYLKSNILITGGEGSSEKPYMLGL